VFDHVTIRVSDHTASERFYDAVMARLRVEPYRGELGTEWEDFSIAPASDAHPVTRRLHVTVAAPTPEGAVALVDPDGNAVETVHAPTARPGSILAVRLRVADLEAAQRFYETIAPHAGTEGLTLIAEEPPTEYAHIAFGATENAVVDAFHRTAMAAGYRDNGPPGERLIYHPASYGAFVLDPDGNNVEVVCHNR
jgi:catechol 2,3-dioxygenase-like lactoylglutathione lyase family enzyme